MRIFRNILIIALGLLIQSTLVGHFSLFGSRPDIPMIMLFFLAINTGPVESVFYGFTMGFLIDAYSPEYLGLNAFVMSIIAYLLNMIRDRLSLELITLKASVAIAACLIHDSLYLLFYTNFDYVMMFRMLFTESLLGEVYSTLIILAMSKLWEIGVNGGVEFVFQGLFGIRRQTY